MLELSNTIKQTILSLTIAPSFISNISQLQILGVSLNIFSTLPPFFRAEPAACGSSQARGRIEAVAACLGHRYSNTGSELL